jgi:cytochrome c-type biogenesis protein CcmE
VRIIKVNNQIKKRFIFLIIIFICFASSIVLISYSLKDQIAYFVSPSELQKMNDIEGRYLKVGGLVKKDSLQFKNNVWVFEITDESNYSINVEYSKALPSLVEENKGIIVEGEFSKNNIFIAAIVLAKHDENYMPQSAIDKLKEEGKWRGIIDIIFWEFFFIPFSFLYFYFFFRIL